MIIPKSNLEGQGAAGRVDASTSESTRDAPPTRVLFVSDHLGFPGGLTHGATTYFTTVLPPLAASGIELTVCFLRDRHPAASELEASGVFPLFLGRGKWNPLALSDLQRIIRERRIDVVHSAGVKGILLGRWAARLEGRKAVIHLHDLTRLTPLLGPLHRRMGSWTDLALVVSRAVAEQAAKEFGVPRPRVRVLHNGLPLARFAGAATARDAVREELGAAPGSRIIGIIGRLVPEKGHGVLLDAMPEVVRQFPRARLIIVGEGPLRREIEARIERSGLTGSARIAGHRDDVPELLSAMDLVVMPSLQEGLGFSALEAMAAGRPVVTSDAGGLMEIVQDGTSGLVVKPGDANALADAMLRILNDPLLAERLVSGGLQRIRDFSLEGHVEALVREYRRLAREAGSPLSR